MPIVAMLRRGRRAALRWPSPPIFKVCVWLSMLWPPNCLSFAEANMIPESSNNAPAP